MAYLAKLARADAIGVVLNLRNEGYVTYVAHNVPADTRWTEGPQGALLAQVLTRRTPEQAATVAIPLADGRTADAVAVAPVVWKDQLVGALAAMLVGRVFTPEETSDLSRVAELVGLELAEANALWRAQRQHQDAETKLRAVRVLQAVIRKERDPNQLLERATAQLAEVFAADGVSIMLADDHGELSVRTSQGLSEEAKRDRKRVGEGISGKVAQNGLETAAMMLGDNLRHDVVGVWAAEEHKLKLRASAGYGPIIPADIPTSTGSDTVLARVLRERRTATASYGNTAEPRPDWAAPAAANFLLAPIGGAHAGVVLGVLVLGRASTAYTSADADFATTVGEYLAGMLQKSASNDVVQRTAATERRRIAQELHDGLAQELTGVVLALEGRQRGLDRDPSLLGPQLAKAARDARATLSDVRQYMAALRQTEEAGGLNLPVTVARLVDDLRRQTGLHVDLEETGVERELEPFVERAVIRIVGESLRNVGQHSGASNAKVMLRYDSEQVVITIEDDGKGFDANELGTAEERGHYGIVGMRERAEGVGGQLVVRSETGRGTIVRASIPYRATAGDVTPGWTGSVDDAEQPGPIEDIERSEKAGFLGRLFGR